MTSTFLNQNPHRIAALFLGAVWMMAACGGCQSGNYRASALPPQLAAAPTKPTRGMRLQNLSAQGQNSTQIVSGDLLEVHLASGAEETPPKPHVARVAEDGTIVVPLVGPVTIAGMEPSEASTVIAQTAIDRGVYRQPSVTVAVTEQATHLVTVLGAVTEPGQHRLPKNSSDILSAIAAAGGLTEEAGVEVEVMRQSGSYLADATPTPEGVADGVQPVGYTFDGPGLGRSGPEIERINLAEASHSKARPRALTDHDVVMVLPKEEKVIHVTGLVKKPDQFELSEEHPIRLLDAVALAGGRSSPVADKVIVLRHPPGQAAPVVIEASLSRAKQDGRENLILAPNDLVSVESTFATATLDTVKDFFRITMGVSSRLTAF